MQGVATGARLVTEWRKLDRSIGGRAVPGPFCSCRRVAGGGRSGAVRPLALVAAG